MRFGVGAVLFAAMFSRLLWISALVAVPAQPGRLKVIVRHRRLDPRGAPGAPKVDVWGAGLNWLVRGDDLKLHLSWLEGRNPGSAHDSGRLLTRMQVVF